MTERNGRQREEEAGRVGKRKEMIERRKRGKGGRKEHEKER